MTVFESSLPVAPTDQLLDTTEITQADGTKAHREGIFVGDPIEASQRVQLQAYQFANKTRYAAAVTSFELRNLCNLMSVLITEQRLTNTFLSRLVGEELTTDDLEEQHGLT